MAEKKLSVKLTLNDKQFQSGLRKASTSLKKFGKSMQRTGQTLSMNFTVPILAAGVASVKMASDFEESLNKTRVAFGDSSVVVEDFAKTTLKSFGIAEGSALEMSSLFGDMATSMGLNQSEAAKMSTSLVGLAGDLASFKNIGIEQAQTALAGIFTGETESLKKMGILITESTLKQFGYNKSMTQTEKIAIRYKAILDQTINAQGDYLRTSEGVANSTRNLTQNFKELSTKFGQELIPLTKQLLSFGTSVVEMLRGMSSETKKSIVEYSLLTAVIGPLLIFFGSIIKSIGTILKVFRKLSAIITVVWNAFKLLTPQGKVLGGLLLAGQLIFQNWGKLSSMFDDLKDSITGVVDESAKLDFGIQNDKSVDPDEIRRRMMSGGVPGIAGVTPPTTTLTTTPTTTPTKKGATSFNINKHIPFLDELPKMKQFAENSLAINQSMADLGNIFPFVSEEAKTAFETMAEAVSPLESVFASFGSTLQQTFINAMQSTDGFFDSFLEGAKQAIKALIAQIAAMSILTFLLGGTNLGAMMGAGSKGGLAGVQSLFGIGGFAKSMGTSSSGGVEIFGTLSGSDILLSNQRAGNSRNRTSGY